MSFRRRVRRKSARKALPAWAAAAAITPSEKLPNPLSLVQLTQLASGELEQATGVKSYSCPHGTATPIGGHYPMMIVNDVGDAHLYVACRACFFQKSHELGVELDPAKLGLEDEPS